MVNDPALASYYRINKEPESPTDHRRRLMFVDLENMAARYVHLTGLFEFDQARFLPIYLEWETAVFSDRLDIDILVPIINARFDFDSYAVADGIDIVRLDRPVQLARMAERRYGANESDDASKAASHAVALYGWFLPNDSPTLFGPLNITSPSAFEEPLRLVHNIFAALRTVRDCSIGFGQVVVCHRNWATNWVADLPAVSVFSLREHPDWRHSARPAAERFDADDLREAAIVYGALGGARTTKMEAAARRLNAAKLRAEERDTILDITIGLETLLTDDSRSEVTYRLSMRMATLARLHPIEGLTPAQVFRASKRLYDFRSAVAHGSAKAQQKRMVTVSKGEPRPAIAIGTLFLRHAIRVLSTTPVLQNPERIDTRLLGLAIVDDF